MQVRETASLRERFLSDGFVSPVRLLNAARAAAERERLETVERDFGSLHYRIESSHDRRVSEYKADKPPLWRAS